MGLWRRQSSRLVMCRRTLRSPPLRMGTWCPLWCSMNGDSTTPEAADQNVDVSGTELPRPPLLRGVERGRSGSVDPQGLGSQGQPKLRCQPHPLTERDCTISAAFTILSFHCARDLAQDLGATVVSRGMPTCQRMSQGGRRITPPAGGRGYVERETKIGTLPDVQ
jgi:hypothetical protein